MKTMKVLTTAFLLFLSASINLVSAQTDSIYNMEVSKTNGTISFYSTYDMNNAQKIYVSSYDKEGVYLSYSVFYRNELNLDSITFDIQITDFTWVCKKTTETIYKVSLSNDLFLSYLQLEEDSVKIELYIEGEGFVPPADSLRSATTVGQSNVLIFYFNPLSTSLKETTESGNYTYKYYLLSGMESKTKPEEKPFIQATFKNGNLISTNKVIQVKK